MSFPKSKLILISIIALVYKRKNPVVQYSLNIFRKQLFIIIELSPLYNIGVTETFNSEGKLPQITIDLGQVQIVYIS